MFVKILTALNTVVSVVVIGGAGYLFFMYGGVVSSNFEYYANLNQLTQDVEMLKTNLTATDPTDTFMVKGNLPNGYVDVTGFLSLADETEALFTFNASDVSDADLLNLAIEAENGEYSVRLGCDDETSLTATPALNLTGEVYTTIKASTLASPVNVRLVFAPVLAEGNCSSSVVAAQLLAAETTTETEKVEPTEAE